MKKHTHLQIEVLEDRTTPSGLQTLHNAVSPAMLDAAQVGNVVSDYAAVSQGVRLIQGESAVVNGARIATWALVSPHDNSILAVGANFSLKIAEQMPEPGAGPAGAFASLEFPAIVQETTFFNHLEIQPEPEGHVTPPGAINPNYYGVPHFDFHFYDMPEEEVRAIPALNPPLPAVPGDKLPPGYLPAGPSIAEMGRHSSPRSVLTDPNPFTAVMVAGYVPDGSRMHFIEPMVAQAFLLGRQDFSLPVPMPRTFDRAMLYPTTFEASFHGNAYSFVFSDFVTVSSATSAANQAAAPSSGLTAVQPASPASGQLDVTALALLGDGGLRNSTMPSALHGVNNAVEQFFQRVSPVDLPNSKSLTSPLATNFDPRSPETFPDSLDLESVLEDLAITNPLGEV